MSSTGHDSRAASPIVDTCARAGRVHRSVPSTVILAVWVLLSAPAPGPALTITAGSPTVNLGDTFSIPMSITGATDLTSWQFNLAFDPTILQANSVTEGPFLSSFCTTLIPCTVFSPGVINNGSGLISLVADSFGDLPPDPSGAGVLAAIEFTALAPGTSRLTFSNVFLNLLDSGFDIVNGQVAVPEPSAGALLAVGLAALAVRRWARRRGAARRSG